MSHPLAVHELPAGPTVEPELEPHAPATEPGDAVETGSEIAACSSILSVCPQTRHCSSDSTLALPQSSQIINLNPPCWQAQQMPGSPGSESTRLLRRISSIWRGRTIRFFRVNRKVPKLKEQSSAVSRE